MAESRRPEGFLALGGYESLLGFLKDVLESEYPKTTPADYCVSIYVDDDDPDGLSYLSEPPGGDEIAEVGRELDDLATLCVRLDGGRDWGLYVGDMDDCLRGSPLAESQRGFARSASPAEATAMRTPTEVDVDQLLAEAGFYLGCELRDHAVEALQTILADDPRHERARTLLAGLGLRNESM